MNDFTQEIKSARDERETGNANKALQMFLEIDKTQLESDQLSDYLGELGLTYWHLKQYGNARTTFNEAREHAEGLGNNSYLAVALRHLSRPELNESDPKLSVNYAKQARQLAFESHRQDLAWFDHGVIATLIFSKGPEDEIKKWFETEAEDLYKIGQSTQDNVAKWVWTSGMLMDRAQIFNTISDLYLALMIAEHFNLARRKEQIEKLIQEFKNK